MLEEANKPRSAVNWGACLTAAAVATSLVGATVASADDDDHWKKRKRHHHSPPYYAPLGRDHGSATSRGPLSSQGTWKLLRAVTIRHVSPSVGTTSSCHPV